MSFLFVSFFTSQNTVSRYSNSQRLFFFFSLKTPSVAITIVKVFSFTSQNPVSRDSNSQCLLLFFFTSQNTVSRYSNSQRPSFPRHKTPSKSFLLLYKTPSVETAIVNVFSFTSQNTVSRDSNSQSLFFHFTKHRQSRQ